MLSSQDHLAVCSWSLQPGNPDDLLARLGEVQMRRVQLALSPVINDRRTWQGVERRLREAGCTIISGMMETHGEDYSTIESIRRTGGIRRDEHWRINRNHAEAVAEFAADLDLDLVTFHAGYLPEDVNHPERAAMVERLTELATLFDDFDITLGLETGQESAATLEAILRDLPSNIGVNFDPANMLLYGTGDPLQAVKQLKDLIVQVHAKDALPSGDSETWGEETRLGEGGVDWGAFMAEVLAIDPPVDIVIEREAGEQRVDDVRVARERLERAIENVRVAGRE